MIQQLFGLSKQISIPFWHSKVIRGNIPVVNMMDQASVSHTQVVQGSRDQVGHDINLNWNWLIFMPEVICFVQVELSHHAECLGCFLNEVYDSISSSSYTRDHDPMWG